MGFIGRTKNGPHPVWKEATKTGTVLNVPLRELSGVTKIHPVFVVENPSVFSAIADVLAAQTPPIVCFHGQPSTAAWMLLDPLVEEEVEIPVVRYSSLYSGSWTA